MVYVTPKVLRHALFFFLQKNLLRMELYVLLNELYINYHLAKNRSENQATLSYSRKENYLSSKMVI